MRTVGSVPGETHASLKKLDRFVCDLGPNPYHKELLHFRDWEYSLLGLGGKPQAVGLELNKAF